MTVYSHRRTDSDFRSVVSIVFHNCISSTLNLCVQTSPSQTTTENEEEEEEGGGGGEGREEERGEEEEEAVRPILQTLSAAVAKTLNDEQEALGKVNNQVAWMPLTMFTVMYIILRTCAFLNVCNFSNVLCVYTQSRDDELAREWNTPHQ